MKATRIFSVCGDPGGAAALAPVLKALQHRPDRVLDVCAYGAGVQVLARAGVRCEALPSGLRPDELESRWKRAHPDVLLCATSVNESDYEKAFILISRRAGVSSVALLDYWSNYALRFGGASGGLEALPDRIAVMDGRAVDEMTAAGFPPDRLVITGQPAFDELAAVRRSFGEARRSAVHAALGVRPGERLVCFLSQPIRQLVASGAGYRHPGYDECEVLAGLCDALAASGGGGYLLAVKPHPRESALELPPDRAGVRCLRADGVDTRELMMASELVAGMTTVALVEACYLGCLVISLQPGARRPDPLACNRAGVSHAVYQWPDMASSVRAMLNDAELRLRYQRKVEGYVTDGCATERVLTLIETARTGVSCE